MLGREAELAALDSLLDQAATTRAGVLTLVGDPGLGKTSLLDETVRRAEARGFRTARVTALELEAGIPAAGLGIMLPMLGRQPRLSTTVLLEALVEASQPGPLLLTVDDAQWLDELSTRALTFAVRRLRIDPVAVVIAGRPQLLDLPGLASVRTLQVPPLGEGDGLALLRSTLPDVSEDVARRIVQALGGVPLALADASRLLPPEALRGQAPLPSPLPVSRAVQDRYARGFSQLGSSDRLALVVLAAEDSGDAGVVVDALSRHGLGVASLRAGEQAGLARLGSRLEFRHPLARAAVHSASAPDERRLAHRLLADSYEARGDQIRTLRHRAAAAIGPDPSLAEALGGQAQARLGQPGGSDEAVALAVLAADLAAGPEQRCSLLMLAAEHASVGLAARLVTRVREETSDPQMLARCTMVSVRSDSRERPQASARRLADLDQTVLGPELSRQRDALLAWVLMNANDTAGLVELAERVDRSTDVRDRWDLLAPLGFAFTYLGQHHQAVPILRRAVELTSAIDPWSLPLPKVAEWAIIPGWLGEDAEHARRFRLMSDVLRASGHPESTAEAAFYMSERLRREGDWPAAEALLQESIDLSTALGQEAGVAYARLACLLSYRGDEPATVQALSSARAEFAATQELWHPVWLAQAEGALALTLGRPRDAIQALDPVRSARFLGRGARDAVALGLVDLVEAYRAVGATAAAGDTCQELSDRLDGIVDPFGLAIVARCRALTSRTGADDLFAEALACHGRTSDAFELARTQLHLGEHLRRSRRPKQARTPLSRALAAFERLGVEPWAERARRELRASGEVVAPPPGTSAESLTPQELRVAMAVREGMTNEAVSQALFLSVKTVEFHLGRVYRKLGIRSRGGLASGMERAGIR